MARKSVITEADEITAAYLHECGKSRGYISHVVNITPAMVEFIIAKYEGRATAYRRAVSGKSLMPRRWVS